MLNSNDAMTGSLVCKAKAFAHKVHGGIGHRRKYTGQPYTVHLAAVATLVEEASGTTEMTAAAWLHDVIEDTDATIETISLDFGPTVAALVGDLTNVSRPGDGNRTMRKSLDRAHIANASSDAKTIKLADLIDNARSIVQHDPSFAKVYMREKQLLLEVLRDGDPVLYDKAAKIVAQYFGA